MATAQKKRCLERGVKHSDVVLWSMVVLGGFLPAVSLSEGTRRGRCWLNIEQPSWESELQVLRAIGGGDEVKVQVCSWQQGLEVKKLLQYFFETESPLQLVLSRAGCSPCCDSGMYGGAAELLLCQAGLVSPRKAILGFKSPRLVMQKAVSPADKPA